MRTDFYYESCGAGKIHGCRWTPDGEIRAVVQIVHGIVEHIGRYDQFARYLNGHGILVVAEDHMGHGGSAQCGSVKGYFTGGWDAAIRDTCRLMQDTMAEFPGIPYILFGHSMGSFMARTILWQYPDSGIRGAILCGTAWMPEALVVSGRVAAQLVCRRKDETAPSELLDRMAFGSYNKRVEHPRTKSDWLTRDAVSVDDYISDPMCGFVASCGLMRDMAGGIAGNQKWENLQKMEKNLPVFFIAGGDDPVGDYGKGVRLAAQQFEKAGMQNITTKIFPLCRHDIINEINRAEIFRAVRLWIQNQCLKPTKME